MSDSQSDRIFSELEDMVLSGKFGDQGRLDEVKLAAIFGVSRTPIREALKKLTQASLVEHIPRRGTFVRQPNAAELFQMFEIMAELEAFCGKLAAKRISEEAVALLKASNITCSQAVEDGNYDAYFFENENFHRLIYEQSGNDVLVEMASKLHRQLRPFRRLQLRLRGRLEQSMREHEEIVSCLEAGDSQGTANALRDHVAVQGEKFMFLMTSFNRNSAN